MKIIFSFSKICIWISLLFCFKPAYCQDELLPGGLYPSGTLILTPSSIENNKIKYLQPQNISFLNYKLSDSSVQLAPVLPENFNWVLCYNMKAQNGKLFNYFFYAGWSATTQPLTTVGRLRMFQEDVTKKIYSNAYHLAFQQKHGPENEIFLLIVSPQKQKVKIKLTKETIGVERSFEFNMEALEAKFINISIPPEEYTLTTWNREITNRSVTNLPNWLFYKGDISNAYQAKINTSLWQPVTIPHTWNATDQFDVRNYKDSINIFEMYYRGDAWYRTTFTIPSIKKNLHHQLNFMAVNQVAEVWLNEKYLGKHIGGYTPFSFDITKYVQYNAPNVLAVKVNNSYNYDIPPHTADFNFLGGIYRQVNITSTSATFVKETKIFTPDVNVSASSIEIKTTLQNDLPVPQKIKLVTNLVNPYNEIVASWIKDTTLQATTTLTIVQHGNHKNPLLWSPEHPYLYKIFTTVYNLKNQPLDQVNNNIGFRFFKISADSGFFLNGQSYKLKGVNFHQDYYMKGNSVDSNTKLNDILWIKKMGANYVRMSHYPHHPYVLDLCDSLGLIVWEEIPVVNTVGREAFIKNAVTMMDEMIHRDINHASIIFWGVGNEYYRKFFPKEELEYCLKTTAATNARAKLLDPYRLTIQAQNDLANDLIMPITDVQARNRYLGWYEGTYNDFAGYMYNQHRLHPTWKLLISEYGAEGKYGYHVNNPTIFDHSETYQVALHKAYWHTIRDSLYLAGATIWNMFDFASFAKIGNMPHVNKKGMMTYDRKPKDVFYYYQSQWATKPMAYIVSHTLNHRTGVKGSKQYVEVFSNCDEVELFQNGKSLGVLNKKQMLKNKKEWKWEVTFSEGLNQFKAIAKTSQQTVSDDMECYFSAVENEQH